MLGLEEVSNKKENKENYTKNKNNKSNWDSTGNLRRWWKGTKNKGEREDSRKNSIQVKIKVIQISNIFKAIKRHKSLKMKVTEVNM